MKKILLASMATLLLGSAAISNITTISQNQSTKLKNTNPQNSINFEGFEGFENIIKDGKYSRIEADSQSYWDEIRNDTREQIGIQFSTFANNVEFLKGRSVNEVEEFTYEMGEKFIDDLIVEDLDMTFEFADFVIDEGYLYTDEIKDIFQADWDGWMGPYLEYQEQKLSNNSRIYCIDPETNYNWCTDTDLNVPQPPEPMPVPEGYTDEDVEATYKFYSFVDNLNIASMALTPTAIIASAAAIAYWSAAWFFGISVPWAIACTVLASALSITATGMALAVAILKGIPRPIDFFYTIEAVTSLVFEVGLLIVFALVNLNLVVPATSWAFPAVLVFWGTIMALINYLDLFGLIK